jgi:RNA-directed DNA polymerase
MNLRYTRYADDLTLSGEFRIGSIINYLRRVLGENGFIINDKKTSVMKQGQRQIVTGIVVNDTMHAPRKLRRTLRQELFYIKKYGLGAHVAQKKIIRGKYLDHLIGQVSYVLSINSKDNYFTDALRTLYEIKSTLPE